MNHIDDIPRAGFIAVMRRLVRLTAVRLRATRATQSPTTMTTTNAPRGMGAVGATTAANLALSPDDWSRLRPHLPPMPPNQPAPHVVVGLSGGVDSAVAAMVLKAAGYRVTAILMRNWDDAEETGGDCSFKADRRDARAVAAALDVPLREVDFVREYWHHVFAPFVQGFAGGATLNPDLACNRHIKFGAFLRHAQSLGADYVATGHYARLARCTERSDDGDEASSSTWSSSHAFSSTTLLTGVDPAKDQSYFLASVPSTALRFACFPLGGLLKTDTRRIASSAGLPVADRRSSAGICFIGRRSFEDFITEYVGRTPGRFINVEVQLTRTRRSRCSALVYRPRFTPTRARNFYFFCTCVPLTRLNQHRDV